MEEKGLAKGHIFALITILFWGTTFIVTKTLLISFQPIEIIIFRFIIGFAVLSLVYPHRLKTTEKKHELYFMAAGLCAVSLYGPLESNAINFTSASNVGVIVSISPFFTILLANWLLEGEKPRVYFFIGFVAAITGISLISFNGAALEFNPVGDLMAVAASFVWAIYSILVKKISGFGYHMIQVTRRIFLYGLIFLIPAAFMFDFEFALSRFTQPINLFCILFLGMGASAMCFVTWNSAVKYLGAVKTIIYVYLIPVIAVVTSVVILNEKMTWMLASGTVLTLAGLVISEWKSVFKSS